MGSTTPTPFGHAMLDQFMLDPNYKNLNHGSFGVFPRTVRDYQRKLRDETEAAPDLCLRYRRPELLAESREALASVLKCARKDVVYVKNATMGVNIILRNLKYVRGDAIIYFSDIYAGCEKTIASLVETTALQSRRIAYTHPNTHDELVQKFRDEVAKARKDGLNVRVAIFDSIVSQPGVRFPFEKLVEVCREEGILSCVDAAHGIGHIPLDIGKLDPDFLVTNVHKWFFVPRGCSVLYVAERNQHLIRTTLPTSHGFAPLPWTLPSEAQQHLAPFPGLTPFEHLFDWVATDDDTSYLCLPAAIEFRNTVCGGEDAIISYCETLAHNAGNRMAEILGTRVLSENGVDSNKLGASQLRRCAFANVQLPISVVSGQDGSYAVKVKPADTNRVARWLERQLIDKHQTFIPIFRHGDGMWVRLSAQIYLELSDFEWLAGVLKDLVERVGLGEPFVDALKV